MEKFELIAPCHFGMEAVLKREILDLGYEITKVEDGKVTPKQYFPVDFCTVLSDRSSGFQPHYTHVSVHQIQFRLHRIPLQKDTESIRLQGQTLLWTPSGHSSYSGS